MRLGYKFFALPLFVSCLVSFPATSQDLSAGPSSGGKVCVAVVNNRTVELLSQDRMTARLVKAVGSKKLSAVVMDSATGNSKELRPTIENSQEMKSRDCEYLVLTMITGSSTHMGPMQGRDISGQHRVPSVDASDPLGGQSGPVYRDELEINFAVFRAGHPDPIVDTRLLDRARWNASDSLMDAMDREGHRVKNELEKR